MKRSLTRLAAFALLAALLLALSSCGHSDPAASGSQAAPQSSAPAETPAGDSASQPGSEAAPSTEDGPAEEALALRTLSCLDEAEPVIAAAPAGEGQALLCCGKPLPEAGGQSALLLDIRADRVLGELELEGEGWQPLGRRENGELLLASPRQGLVLRCGETLQILDRLAVSGNRVFFSPEEDCLYLCSRRSLTRLDFSGGSRELLRLTNAAAIEDLDPEARLVLVSDLPDNENADNLYGLYDFEGKLLWSQQTKAMAIGFAGGQLLTQDYDALGEAGSEKLLAAYEPGNALAQRACVSDLNEKTIPVPGSSWLCALLDADPEQTNSRSAAALSLLSLSEGKRIPVCELEGSPDLYPVSAGDGESILICAVTAGKNRPFVVRPRLLSGSAALQTAAYTPEPAPRPEPEYPARLSEIRSLADGIEEKYGVTIHFGDAVLEWPREDYPLVRSSGDYGEHESDMLRKTLECLDRTLAAYPADFTGHFRNFMGRGGLRFFLATEFRSESSSFVPNGVSYQAGGWYNIDLVLVDCTETVIHHELWHTVDSYLSASGQPVDEELWNGMNPEGFEYGNDLEGFLEDESVLPFILGKGEPAAACVIRSYSTVSEHEDRATLLEYILRPEAPARAEENFAENPILKAKLDYLAGLSRSAFGYVYWDEILKGR